MLRITGRVVLIYKHEVVTRNNDKFEVMDLVLKKQMNNQMRNIHFEITGKLMKEASKYRKGDKIAVWFYLDSKSNNKKWFTNLKVVEIEKPSTIKKQNTNEINFNDYE